MKIKNVVIIGVVAVGAFIGGFKTYEQIIKHAIKKGKLIVGGSLITRDNVVIFQSRKDADEVLSQLHNLIDDYGYATVADLHDLCGTPSTYKESKKGWKDLHDLNVKISSMGPRPSVPGGKTQIINYRLILPEPILIEEGKTND